MDEKINSDKEEYANRQDPLARKNNIEPGKLRADDQVNLTYVDPGAVPTEIQPYDESEEEDETEGYSQSDLSYKMRIKEQNMQELENAIYRQRNMPISPEEQEKKNLEVLKIREQAEQLELTNQEDFESISPLLSEILQKGDDYTIGLISDKIADNCLANNNHESRTKFLQLFKDGFENQNAWSKVPASIVFVLLNSEDYNLKKQSMELLVDGAIDNNPGKIKTEEDRKNYEKYMEKDNIKFRNTCINLLESLASQGWAGTEIVDLVRDNISKNIDDQKYRDVVIKILADLDRGVNDQNKNEELHSWIQSVVNDKMEFVAEGLDKDKSYENSKKILINSLCSAGLEKRAEQSIEYYLSEKGLDGGKIFEAWKEGNKSAWDFNKMAILNGEYTRDNGFQKICSDNLDSLKKIEDENPGSASALSKEFGIMNFGRYTPEVLTKQYNEKDNLDKKYGIVAFPYADWNGAFNQNRLVLSKLSSELESNDLSMRIFECKNTVRLYDSIMESNEKYNQDGDNPLEFMIIGGHGSPNHIAFGPESDKKSINGLNSDDINKGNILEELNSLDMKPHYKKLRNLKRHGVQEIKEKNILKKDAPVVLVSCSTGSPRGIASKMSEKFNTSVAGPVSPASLTDINVNMKDGKLLIKPEYTDKHNVFKAGKVEKEVNF